MPRFLLGSAAVVGLHLLGGCGDNHGAGAQNATASNAAPPAAAGPAPLSGGLPKNAAFPGYYLDHLGAVADPRTKQPAIVAAGQPILFDGFGFDPIAKRPAKGVDVVVDGHPYATTYGDARPDVAEFNKSPLLKNVEFKTTLPPNAISPGNHVVVVRVIASGGADYFESPEIKFQVK